MRAFIALPLPDDIKGEIEKIQRQLNALALDAKWVAPENCHLTFTFLGDIDEAQTAHITQAMKKACEKFSGFEISLKEFGFFPNSHRPRVFFIETDHSEQLREIACSLEDQLETLGFPKERKFKSHITLARFRSKKNIAHLLETLQTIPLRSTFSFKHIVLYKSTLTSHGPIYEELFKIDLKK